MNEGRIPFARSSFCIILRRYFIMVTASILSISSGRKYVYASLRCYREGRCSSNGVNKQSRRLDIARKVTADEEVRSYCLLECSRRKIFVHMICTFFNTLIGTTFCEGVEMRYLRCHVYVV